MDILWTPRARERLKEIFEYIARGNPEIARSWALVIRSRVDTLRDHPRIGRIVPEYQNPEVREILHGDYRIIYRLTSQQVDILTVLHCAQLLPLDAQGS